MLKMFKSDFLRIKICFFCGTLHTCSGGCVRDTWEKGSEGGVACGRVEGEGGRLG